MHQRFDDVAAEEVVATSSMPASTTTGRYKSWRIPVVAVLTRTLTWWAVGEPDGIRGLCERIDQVGKKRAAGEGVVTDWAVEDVGDPAWGPVLWREDGHIARAVPVRAAGSLGLDSSDVDTIAAGYRPPYWRGRMVTEPGQIGRRWEEVIAPWTTRPSSVP